MKTVYVTNLPYEEPYLTEDGTENEYTKKVEITEEFWKRYLDYESEHEYMHSKLHRLFTPLHSINNIP